MMNYEKPEVLIASLVSKENIAENENAESVIEYQDPDRQTTKPIDIG